MSDGQGSQKYSAGERIIIGIELHDDSGIYDVTGLFVHADNPRTVITLPGYGGGAQRATVYIQNVATSNTPPGQYVCKYIQAQDGRGNYTTLHPDITFYVDQQSTAVDDQGPQLNGWNFPSEEVEVVERSIIEIETTEGDTYRYGERQPVEIEGMAEGTGAQEDIQVDTPDTPGTPEDTQEDVHQLIEGKIEERISGMTEDTGAGKDIGLHIERRMDEIAHDVTEDTGAEGDVHLHVERRMNEMAKKMFEDD